MSAVGLYRDQEMIRFVWGDNCDVPDGYVRTLHYHHNKTPPNYMTKQTKPAARRYWAILVKSGFKRADCAWDPALIALVDGNH